LELLLLEDASFDQEQEEPRLWVEEAPSFVERPAASFAFEARLQEEAFHLHQPRHSDSSFAWAVEAAVALEEDCPRRDQGSFDPWHLSCCEMVRLVEEGTAAVLLLEVVEVGRGVAA